jgi:hypothetical protein
MTLPIDDLLGVWQWRSAHATRVAAPPQRALASLRAVSARDLPVSGALMRVRMLGHRARDPRPLLESMAAIGLVVLSDDDGEVVLGGIMRPWQLHAGHLPVGSPGDFRAFNRPGWVRVAAAFVVEPDGAGARLRTETRIAATDEAARRRFGRYWRVIGPFSAITRRELLATVRRRAEGSA